MYHLLLYDLVDHFIERRAPYRDQHLKLVREAHTRGELVLAGAFAEPVDGAALVFKGETGSVAAAFAENDPYVSEGLVKAWRVHQWNVVVGGD